MIKESKQNNIRSEKTAPMGDKLYARGGSLVATLRDEVTSGNPSWTNLGLIITISSLIYVLILGIQETHPILLLLFSLASGWLTVLLKRKNIEIKEENDTNKDCIQNSDEKKKRLEVLYPYITQMQNMVARAEEVTNTIVHTLNNEGNESSDNIHEEITNLTNSDCGNESYPEESHTITHELSSYDENSMDYHIEDNKGKQHLYVPLTLHLEENSIVTIFCCDSGSTCSFITEETLNRLDKSYRTMTRRQNGIGGVGVGGVKIPIVGKTELVCSWQHCNDTFKENFKIIKGSEDENIIGLPFLTRFQASINCKLNWELKIQNPRFLANIPLLYENEICDCYLQDPLEEKVNNEIEDKLEDLEKNENEHEVNSANKGS